MRCELVREEVSAAFDGEVEAHEDLTEHVEGCAACSAWREQVAALRRELRMTAVGAAPDVAPAVLEQLGRTRRAVSWTNVAAAFVAAVVAGAAFVGLRPDAPGNVAAADVPRLVLEAQHTVERLTASVAVTEHGWHPQVPTRRFAGSLQFAAPESLTVRLTDRTSYPSEAWTPNDVAVAVEPDRWWARGQVGCPQAAQPVCAGPPRTRVVDGREPFDPHGPAALDLVVPVRSFRHAAAPAALGTRTLDGREAVGVSVTVAQVGPLLDGFRAVGDWRALHPGDPVELWLDAEALVPLELTVTAAGGDERSLWAARHGYAEDAGDPLLEVRFSQVKVNGPDRPPRLPPPVDATVRDAGFRPQDAASVRPGWLPDGMALYRAGRVTSADGPAVDVAAWTDGRAWVTVRATTQWQAERLFGGLGAAVRPVELGPAGVGYVGDGGAVGLHGDGLDVVVAGSVDEATLRRVAASLGVSGRSVPAGWPEAAGTSLEAAAASHDGLLIADVDGFDEPAVRVRGEGVELLYAGPGTRGFVLSQAPGDALNPPLEPDVRGVAVRGSVGRYTPALGELEWVEAGAVVSLRSHTLALAELLAIAEGLDRR